MLLTCLLAILAHPSQDPTPAPTLTERLDRLIEKTNAYEHFSATYSVARSNGEKGQLRIAYRAPDLGTFEYKTDKTWMRQTVVKGTIETRGQMSDGPAVTATVHGFEGLLRLLDSASGWLEEYFPRKTAPSKTVLSDGVLFNLGANADGEGWNLGAGIGTGARLGWLERLKQDAEHADLSESSKDEVICTHGTTRECLDLDSGFLKWIEGQAAEGKGSFTLDSLDLETSPDAAEFQPPQPAADARDVSAEYEAAACRLLFTLTRRQTYGALAWRIDHERLEWNEETRDKVRKLLRRVHEELLPSACKLMIAQIETQMDGIADALAQRLADADPDARPELKAGAERWRAGLETQLLQTGGEFAAPGQFELDCKLRASLEADLFALEEPILREVYSEKISKPLLARFDERVTKQLEAK